MRKRLMGFVVVVSFLLALSGISFAKGGQGGAKGGDQSRGSDVSGAVGGAHEQGMTDRDIAETVHGAQAENKDRGSDVSRAVHEAQEEGLKGEDIANAAHEAIGEGKEDEEKGEENAGKHKHHDSR